MVDMAVVLRTARRVEERLIFDSACKITSGEGGFVDDDGVWNPTATLIYEGRCSFLPTARTVREVDVVGEQVALHPYTVKVPKDTPARVGQIVEITACPDPDAVGAYLSIQAVQFSQWQVNRVLGCEVSVVPE